MMTLAPGSSCLELRAVHLGDHGVDTGSGPRTSQVRLVDARPSTTVGARVRDVTGDGSLLGGYEALHVSGETALLSATSGRLKTPPVTKKSPSGD